MLGPIIVNCIADPEQAAGRSGPALYIVSFSIMIGLLLVGLVCNELIKPVDEKWHESREQARELEEATR